jgi:hypothetical protein
MPSEIKVGDHDRAIISSTGQAAGTGRCTPRADIGLRGWHVRDASPRTTLNRLRRRRGTFGSNTLHSGWHAANRPTAAPELAKVMKALQPGDAVVVTKLNRIARSSRDLHNILGKLKDLGCGFVSLGEGWCDTTSSVGRLVISIMAGIAEFERELIRARCQTGFDRAKAKGTRFGRKPVLDAGKRKVLAERYAAGETMAKLAREYECGEATIWRALQGQGYPLLPRRCSFVLCHDVIEKPSHFGPPPLRIIDIGYFGEGWGHAHDRSCR